MHKVFALSIFTFSGVIIFLKNKQIILIFVIAIVDIFGHRKQESRFRCPKIFRMGEAYGYIFSGARGMQREGYKRFHTQFFIRHLYGPHVKPGHPILCCANIGASR